MSNQISLIVPMYNASRHIEKCLDGIMAQTRKDFEVLLIDDCSADDTVSKAEKYPFKVIKLKERSRVSKVRNYGVENTSGEIIIFVDADVVIKPDSVEEIVSFISEPDTDVVCGNYTEDTPQQSFFSQFLNLFAAFRYSRPPEFINFIFACFFAIKRDAYINVGGFNEKMFYYEDVDIGYRLIRKGYRIRLNPRIKVTHLKQYNHLSLICDRCKKTSAAGTFYRRVGLAEAPRVDTLPLTLKLASISVMLSVASLFFIKISLIPIFLFLALYALSIIHFLFYLIINKNLFFALGSFCFFFEFILASGISFIYGFLKSDNK